MEQNIITKRLTNDKNYKESIQAKMSSEDIANKLIDYERVSKEDIFKIPIGTHIRYFTIDPKTGKKQFRMGGVLSRYGDNNEYIILSNGTFSWSVQLNTSIIYKKLSPKEFKENIKDSAKNELEMYKKKVEAYEKEIKELKKTIKEIKEATLKSKNKKI